MGSKQPSTTTQVQKVELPKWVDAASQANYKDAQAVAAQPYQAYTGQTVANQNAMEQAAGGTLNSGIAGSNAAFGGALTAAQQAAGYKPQMVAGPAGVGNVTAGKFTDADISKYMDPNIDNVVNTTLSGLDRSNAQTQQGIADSARGAGAWGGSRFGVQQAVAGAEGDRVKASTEAGLRSAAFTDAAGRATADQQTALQASLANQQSGLTTQAQQLAAAQGNQSAGLAGAGLNLQGGQLAGQTGSAISEAAGKNSILQSTLGQSTRAVDQAKLDAAQQAWQQQQDYPTEQLNLKLAALGMSPYGKTTTGVTTQSGGSSSSGLLTGLGGIMSIASLFSDRRVKKDVKKLGKVPGTDLNKYEFKYKKGFMGHAGTEKLTGLMAQDVEKKIPGAVSTVKVKGKKVKVVDYGKALEGAAGDPNGRSDKGHVRRPYKPRVGIGSRMKAA